MLRELHHIPLCQLKVSKLNVRRQGAKEIDSLAASIAALGIIQPRRRWRGSSLGRRSCRRATACGAGRARPCSG